MITKNKLSGQPNMRPKEQFNTSSSKTSRFARPTGKNTRKFLLLLVTLLIVVAGATFATIIMMRGNTNTDAPANEIPAIDDNIDEDDAENNVNEDANVVETDLENDAEGDVVETDLENDVDGDVLETDLENDADGDIVETVTIPITETPAETDTLNEE